MLNKLKSGAYTKTIVAVSAGLLTVLAVVVSVASDGNISGNDLAAIITAAVGAITGSYGVYQLPNMEAEG